jgi:hypothetical protein
MDTINLEQNKEEIFKKMKFSFDLSSCKFEIDALQNKLLEFYIRADSRFRRAFSMNYTTDFLQYIKDKSRLREPCHISVIGNVRSGKSVTAISLCCFHMACYGKIFSIDYICANAYEFLEKLKVMPEEKLRNSIFLIDEEKQSVYGVGSTARKMKLTDVQNIIAINNISTISLNPNSWANKEANYGLRTFGRCFKNKICRLMLYNLSEKGKGGELPMGNVYLPIFTAYLPKEYADSIEKAYLQKKNEWVMGEMRGEGDVLAEIRKKSAESFCRDKNFLQIKKKKERLGYIQQKMGSEWTSKECEDVLILASLLQQGLLDSSE